MAAIGIVKGLLGAAAGAEEGEDRVTVNGAKKKPGKTDKIPYLLAPDEAVIHKLAAEARGEHTSNREIISYMNKTGKSAEEFIINKVINDNFILKFAEKRGLDKKPVAKNTIYKYITNALPNITLNTNDINDKYINNYNTRIAEPLNSAVNFMQYAEIKRTNTYLQDVNNSLVTQYKQSLKTNDMLKTKLDNLADSVLHDVHVRVKADINNVPAKKVSYYR
jgi:hypothetical protein